MSWISRVGALELLILGGLQVPVRAEPLSKEECDKLKLEEVVLDKAGVKDVMLKGPQWAKANAGADKLKQVERYITIEEHLSFRCGLARVRLNLPFAEEDQPPVPPEDAKGEPGAPATPPAVKPKPKAKAKAKQKAAATGDEPPTAAAPAEAPVKTNAKPKPAPKPKAEDAYKPPVPANPAADPFAKPKGAN